MFLIPLRPPVVCELHLSEGQSVVFTADPIQSEYEQKHLSLSNCWTLDHWMSGGSLAGVTTLTLLANSLVLRCALHFTGKFSLHNTRYSHATRSRTEQD